MAQRKVFTIINTEKLKGNTSLWAEAYYGKKISKTANNRN